MDASDQAAITLQVPVHHLGSLKELLREHPRLQLLAAGWIVRKCVVYGPPQDVAAIRPKLKEWERNCVVSDAW